MPETQVIVRRRKVLAEEPAQPRQDVDTTTPAERRDPKVHRLHKAVLATPTEATPPEPTHDDSAAAQPAEKQRRRRVREDRIPSAPVVTRHVVAAVDAVTRDAVDTGMGKMERERVRADKQRLDELMSEIEAARAWTCSDRALEREWERLERLLKKTSEDVKRALKER